MSRPLALLVALCLGFLSMLAHAAAPAPRAGADLPGTPEAWLSQMLDARRNGVEFKDPAAFAEWLDAITEPRFMTALATVAVDPGTCPKVIAHGIDPRAARNWAEFTDPQLYLRWMLASASPAYQQAIVSKLADPAKLRRWIENMGRPDTYAALAVAFGQAPLAWMRAPLAPASYEPFLQAMHPATAMTWFGALAEGMGKQMVNPDWRQLPADQLAGVRYRY